MGEHPAPPGLGTCGAVGQDSPFQAISCDGNAIHNSFDPIREERNANNNEKEREREAPDNGMGTASSRAVHLLDEELAELEQLIKLQRRQVEALERLRNQWLSGERCDTLFSARFTGDELTHQVTGAPSLCTKRYDLRSTFLRTSYQYV